MSRREIFVSEYDHGLGTAVLATPLAAMNYSIDGKKPLHVVTFTELAPNERVVDVETLSEIIDHLDSKRIERFGTDFDGAEPETLLIDKLKALRDGKTEVP